MGVKIVIINVHGARRILDGKSGMTFIVNHFSNTDAGMIAHIRDYRYRQSVDLAWQIWSIDPDGYEVIEQ